MMSLQQIQEVIRSLVPPSDLVIGDITLRDHEKIILDTAHFCGTKGVVRGIRAVDRKKSTYINMSMCDERFYHYAVGFWDFEEKKNICVAHGKTKNYQYALSQYLALKGR